LLKLAEPVHANFYPELINGNERGPSPSANQTCFGRTRVRSIGGARGRHAQTPAEIAPAGWRDATLRVFHSISEDRITTISGGVPFFVLLALFPGLAGLISLYGLFADSTTIGQHLGALGGILPEGGQQILRDQLQ
jgi:membrane protein